MTTVLRGKKTPRNKVGDKKGYHPQVIQHVGKSKHRVDTASQVFRHGKQGMSHSNWDAFGARGSEGRNYERKRKVRLQNSPVPHLREHENVRFDSKAGRLVRTDRTKRFSSR